MTYLEQIERLITVSRNKPLLPESFIPWDVPIAAADEFLPEQLVSLHGLPEYEQLSGLQKRDLARHEVVQVMYSYAWSEGLFCMFTIYPVLRKVSELHNIEEARHILFTKLFLKKYTSKAGFIKRCMYSYIILMNIYFMRSLYVKKEIFKRIGCSNFKSLYRKAVKNYNEKFGANCLDDIKLFVTEINGFNRATKWAWRTFLKTKI